ncbi:MAG: hypothetical protein QM785_18180 [Pyrinomonadaceae bacterium]
MRTKRRVTVREETVTTVVKITHLRDFHCPQCGFDSNDQPIIESEPEVFARKTSRISRNFLPAAETANAWLK